MDEIRGAGSIAEHAFDVHIPFLSLPTVLGTTLETIPCMPYLRVPRRRMTATTTKRTAPPLPHSRPLRVGIAWAGSPTQGNDRNRSARLADFAPCSRFRASSGTACRWAKRQRDRDRSCQRSAVSGLEDWRAEIGDWADTAAIQQLDLVISVDTGVVHLAGALGSRSGCCCALRPTGAGCWGAPTAPGIPPPGCSASPAQGLGERDGRGGGGAGRACVALTRACQGNGGHGYRWTGFYTTCVQFFIVCILFHKETSPGVIPQMRCAGVVRSRQPRFLVETTVLHKKNTGLKGGRQWRERERIASAKPDALEAWRQALAEVPGPLP